MTHPGLAFVLDGQGFLAGLVGVAAREPGDLDVFLALSADLTGVPPGELDREAGDAYLQALRSWGAPIDRALASRALGGLSERVLELWYTGRYETPTGHVVAALSDGAGLEGPGLRSSPHLLRAGVVAAARSRPLRVPGGGTEPHEELSA